MFKNVLKIIASGSLMYGGFAATTVAIQKQHDITERLNQLNVSAYANTGYKSFLTTDLEDLMYYGRVLKFYLANSVTVEQSQIDALYSKVSTVTTNTTIQDLLVQNIIASTMNISIYGSSSDQEFFAESFSKWLLTPDSQKNKSWEILNYFFVNVLPSLINNGGQWVNYQQNFNDVINEQVLNQAAPKYNLTLTNVSTTPVNLNYASTNIGWSDTNYLQQTIYYISSGLSFNNQSISLLIQALMPKSNEDWVFENWMNDSLTPASQASIDLFKQTNPNKFSTFDDLNSTLVANSKDVNGKVQTALASSFAAIEKSYLKSTPQNSGEAKTTWTASDTAELKQTSLNLFNYLYTFASDNLDWLLRMSSALIFAADSQLVDQGTSTMGVTITYMLNSRVSTAESFVVILGSALTFGNFNNQYQKSFWSSPQKFAVVVHEFGHVLDSFGGKMNIYRAEDNSKYRTLGDKYKGTIFGDGSTSSTGITSTIKVLLIILGVSAAIGVGISLVMILGSKKKKAA